MALPVHVPAAMSGIKALIRFTQRLDVIRSVGEASEGLPFTLPPAPTVDDPHIDDMVQFFREADEGKLVLELRDLGDDFEFLTDGDPRRGGEDVFNARRRLLDAYYEAAGVTPRKLGTPGARGRVGVTPDPEMLLAWYVVESHRLSRNPELTRILMTTADTLMEFGAENAALFTSDPRRRRLLSTFLEEFAGKGDFDDRSVDLILRRLLGSTVAAAVEHQGEFAEEPALRPLFSALAEVRQDLGDDFVAVVISSDGFERVLGTYLVHMGEDPSFVTRHEALRDILGAVLTDVGTELDEIRHDPAALTGVLEAALVTAADYAPGLLDRELEGRPLMAAALGSVTRAVAEAREAELFNRIVDGTFLARAYRTLLEAIAADPGLVGVRDDADELASRLVSSIAATLSVEELEDFSVETLRELGTGSLGILADHPRLAGRDNVAAGILGAALGAAARILEDGTRPEELLEIADTVIGAAAGNLGLLEMDEHLAAVLSTMGGEIARVGLHRALDAGGRRVLLLAVLDAMAANPAVWERLAETDLVRPLARAVVDGLEDDPTRLLRGPAVVPALRRILTAAARRGCTLVEGEVEPEWVRDLLGASLRRAGEEVGRSIDRETLPRYLERVVLAFLDSPFDIVDDAALEALFDSILHDARITGGDA